MRLDESRILLGAPRVVLQLKASDEGETTDDDENRPAAAQCREGTFQHRQGSADFENVFAIEQSRPGYLASERRSCPCKSILVMGAATTWTHVLLSRLLDENRHAGGVIAIKPGSTFALRCALHLKGRVRSY
jgi:hypothetical protein